MQEKRLLGRVLIERHNGTAYAYVKYPWHP